MCVACCADGVGSKRNDENMGRRKTDFIFQEEWSEPVRRGPAGHAGGASRCGRALQGGRLWAFIQEWQA